MKLDDELLKKLGHTIQIAGAIYVGEGRVFLAPFPDDNVDVI